jgi:uncharacterized protein (DUF4415 family)
MPKHLTLRDGRRIELNTAEEEAAIQAGIAADPDTAELDDEWFAGARPAREVLPPEVYAGLVAMRRRPGQRGPQKAPTKERITIRLSRDVTEHFRATGEGWQGRIDDALRDWLRTHTPG